jgi:Spy/CpxP family protein refolding chaperone
MSRYVAWAFAALLFAVPASSAAAECEKAQGHQDQAKPGTTNGGQKRSHFWTDPKLRAELGITDQQSASIEAIWQNGLQQRIDSGTRLETLEAQLDQMLRDAALDEAAFVAQLDKVEMARSEASKTRMVMLYRINKVLKPEQRAKLAEKAKAMRDQRASDGRRDR